MGYIHLSSLILQSTSAEIFLDGDYESSDLCQKAKAEYTNITKGLVKEYIKFIGISDLKLSHQDK